MGGDADAAALAVEPVARTTAGSRRGRRPGRSGRERDLRLAWEEALRTSARLVSDDRQRVEPVDRADDARPRTWT